MPSRMNTHPHMHKLGISHINCRNQRQRSSYGGSQREVEKNHIIRRRKRIRMTAIVSPKPQKQKESGVTHLSCLKK